MFVRLAAIVAIIAVSAGPALAADRILVFAAASMKDAVESIAERYSAETGTPVVVSLAGSGTLARQIEAGAPAEIYVAANPAWMDYLAERGLVDEGSRDVLAGNALVVVRRGGGEGAQAMPHILLGADRFAMGDPIHVPAGIYAKQALEALGLWDRVGAKAVLGENVRVALAMAARGDVDGAIVYASDATMRDDLEIAYEFPAASHLPILYPVALTQHASDEARAFLAYLLDRAREGALMPFGFTRPPGETGSTVHDG